MKRLFSFSLMLNWDPEWCRRCFSFSCVQVCSPPGWVWRQETTKALPTLPPTQIRLPSRLTAKPQAWKHLKAFFLELCSYWRLISTLSSCQKSVPDDLGKCKHSQTGSSVLLSKDAQSIRTVTGLVLLNSGETVQIKTHQALLSRNV